MYHASARDGRQRRRGVNCDLSVLCVVQHLPEWHRVDGVVVFEAIGCSLMFVIFAIGALKLFTERRNKTRTFGCKVIGVLLKSFSYVTTVP